MTATSVQYIGLTLTYASSFQMLRGAVIIFTGMVYGLRVPLIEEAPSGPYSTHEQCNVYLIFLLNSL